MSKFNPAAGSAEHFILDAVPQKTALQLWWDFTDGAGATVTDKSGNGRNGTIASGTWQTLAAAGLSAGLKKNGWCVQPVTGVIDIGYTAFAVARPWTAIIGGTPSNCGGLSWWAHPNADAAVIMYELNRNLQFRGSGAYVSLQTHNAIMDAKYPLFAGMIGHASAGKGILQGASYDYGASTSWDLAAGAGAKLGNSAAFTTGPKFFFFALWNVALTATEVADACWYAATTK